MSFRERISPRPFLKWAGGKNQLLADLFRNLDLAGSFGRYHEPFLGGGCLFFRLMKENRLGHADAFLSDNNANLMDAYTGLKEVVDEVIEILEKHQERHGKEYYYEIRAQGPTSLSARAARVIYLNKTCFNGLFRENSRGEFNVPFGRYENPTICDAENLRACAKALRKAKLETRHFQTVMEHAEPNDLVYFDPPYHPVSRTASFTAYDKNGFNQDSQRQLAEVFDQLTKRGVKVLLSNSCTEFIEDLYRDRGTIEHVQANRAVNSRADRRGKVTEVLVRNF